MNLLIQLIFFRLTLIINKIYVAQQLLQQIWTIGLMENWFCIWGDLANPNNGA